MSHLHTAKEFLRKLNLKSIRCFLGALLFCFIGMTLYSCEVISKRPIKRLSLSPTHGSNHEFNFFVEDPGHIRLTASFRSYRNKAPITSLNIAYQFIYREEALEAGKKSPTFSSGGTLTRDTREDIINYGLFKTPNTGEYTLLITANTEMERLKSYQFRILPNATDLYFSFVQYISIFLLILSFVLKEYRFSIGETRHAFKFIYVFFTIVMLLLNIGT